MYVYNLNELEQLLIQTLDNSHTFNIYYHALYETLFKTGIRASEALNFSLWEIQIGDLDDPNNINEIRDKALFTLHTLKENSIRVFRYAELSPVYGDCLLFSYRNPLPANYDNAERWLQRMFPVANIYIKTKPAGTHIFRHYKVKKLDDQGYTLTEIANYIGHKDEKNTLVYLTSTIYTP